MPVLERSAVQDRPEAFCSPGASSLSLSSSGSTGVPLPLRLARRARRRRRRQFASFFVGNGWLPWHRALSLRVLPDSSARLGSALLDGSVLRRRVTASVLESPDHLYELLRRIEPQILHGLPSALEHLANRAEADGWRPAGLRRIFTCSEALTPETRRLLERAFGAPVIDSYAAAEALVGFECSLQRGIHVLEDNVIFEVVGDDGACLPPGEVGRVVLTTLDNRAMPLLRYAIGDMAVAPSPSSGSCPCGRPGRLVPRVLGRQVPMFVIGGAEVSPWGVIARMHELEDVRQFQLIQPAPDQVLVLIRARPSGGVDHRLVERLIAEEIGPSLLVEVREVAAIERLASGKAAPALVRPGTGSLDP